MKRRNALLVLGGLGLFGSLVSGKTGGTQEMNQEVKTGKAPKAIGPYSQAIIANGLVFCSGQISIDPATNELYAGPVEEQARQVLRNLGAVLEAAGSSFDRVVKTTIFLQDMNDFGKVNQVYAEFFKTPFPARATVQVARLPRDAKVEIEAIALAK